MKRTSDSFMGWQSKKIAARGFMLLYTADPGASDGQAESLSTDSQSATYPVTSTESDPTELSSMKGLWTHKKQAKVVLYWTS